MNNILRGQPGDLSVIKSLGNTIKLTVALAEWLFEWMERIIK